MGRNVMVRLVRGTKCLWGEMSRGEMPLGELSMGRVVHGGRCPCAKCLWGEMSLGKNVMGRIVIGANFDGALSGNRNNGIL
jgi:hypothetical protein